MIQAISILTGKQDEWFNNSVVLKTLWIRLVQRQQLLRPAKDVGAGSCRENAFQAFSPAAALYGQSLSAVDTK